MTRGGGGGGEGTVELLFQIYLSLSHLFAAFLLGIGGCFLCNDQVGGGGGGGGGGGDFSFKFNYM